MSDITITVQNDATGSITIDGTPHALQASTVAATRDQAMSHAKTHARTTGRAVNVTANDPTGTFHLAIQPDGTISNRPAAEPASWEQPSAEPIITEVPDAQAPDIEQTRPRPARQHASTPAPAPEGTTPAPTATPAGSDAAPHAPLEDASVAPGWDTDPVPTPEGAALQHADAPVAETAPVADLVDADPRWSDIAAQPATQGIRGSLNKFGMKFAPDASEINARREELRAAITREDAARREDEQRQAHEHEQETRRQAREREAAARDRAERDIIQTNYGDPKTVSFMNDKGGVGKTTDELCIANALGQIRGGDVVAWDANETRGTLGFRAKKDNHRRNVVDFLNEAATDFTTVEGSKRSTLTRYTRQQGDSKFSVLASDESREKQDQVDGQAFRTVHEILSRFYSLILVDTGNNHQVEHFRAALAATDQLVIPVSPGEDGAYAAELMIDNFIGWGYGDLVKNAVVLLHDSATQRGDARAIAAKFENRVRAILPIPFDPTLDAGGEIDFEALKPATLAAYQTAAAAISHGLAGTKEA